MPSGKQLSFQHGEVAPSQHFKSDAVTYSEGLRKLRNMYVRRDGGVSNRSGFRLVSVPTYQHDVSSLFSRRKIRTFIYDGVDYTVVTEAARNYLYVDGSEVTEFFYEGKDRSGGVLIPPSPQDVRFVPTKDGVFITPACTFSGCTVVGSFDINTMTANVFIKNGRAHVVQRFEKSEAAFVGTKGFTGIAPFLPVSYLVTATMRDGREIQVTNDASTGFASFSGGSSSANPGGNSLCFPHSQLTSNVKLVFTTLAEIVDIKFFNLYRASGQEGIGQSFYKLAARINNSGGLTFNFTDYGADDPSMTPPLDTTYFNTGAAFHAREPFRGVQLACYYQQRLLAMGANIPNLQVGEVLASALGAPKQMAGPLITSNTGSFVFSVPLTDGSGISGCLSMERALLMTLKGVYIARGGDQGMLTPLAVNPLRISDEGCDPGVEPVMSSSRGFWINAAKTKLMAAEFGADGNVSMGEASILSNHFLSKGVIQLETISGDENSVYALTLEGKVIRVTVGDAGAFGFSLYETAGFVESIYRSRVSLAAADGSGSQNPEVLFAYVVRNGVRYKETIAIREDRFKDQELFADCGLNFGTRLVLDKTSVGAPGYIKSITFSPWNATWPLLSPFGLHINIQPPIAGSHNWLAGDTIKIRSNVNLLVEFAAQDFVIHFYYDQKDSDGNYELDDRGNRKQRSLRYVINQAVPAVVTGESVAAPWAYTALDYEYTGYFTADVPADLRDVRGQYTTADYEFFLRQTRWAPAFKFLKVATSGSIQSSPLRAIYNAAVGGDVVLVGEGSIMSSPLNPNKESQAIEIVGADYRIDFDDYYAWGYVGLPYTSEFETLDIETGDNRTLTDAKKLINKVGLGVLETRGGFFGVPGKELSNMEEIQLREDSDPSQQTQNKDGHIEVMIPTEWTEGGRVTIKNVDPVPMTILSVYPRGIAGD